QLVAVGDQGQPVAGGATPGDGNQAHAGIVTERADASVGRTNRWSTPSALGYTARPAEVAESVDAADSKSAALKSVWVRVPPSAPVAENPCESVACKDVLEQV